MLGPVVTSRRRSAPLLDEQREREPATKSGYNRVERCVPFVVDDDDLEAVGRIIEVCQRLEAGRELARA